MMKNYLNVLLIILFAALLNLNLHAQTCDDPLVLIDDDLEAYMPGDATSQAAHWEVWPGATVGGEVSTDFASSGSQSIKIDGNIDGQDALLYLSDQTSGHFTVEWQIYIPEGKNAYLNLQHEAPTMTEGFWGFDLFFDEDGIGELNYYDAESRFFEFDSDEWIDIYFLADIDANQARMIIGENTIQQWPLGNGSGTPTQNLNSLNFYPFDTSYQYYIDDVRFQQIPAAEAGQYCYTAVEAVVGTNTVPDLTCFGGGYDLGGGSNGGAERGYWFTYSPATDGILSISNCLQGVDSRAWIFEGTCNDIAIVGVNDDQCDMGGGDLYASYREALVKAGTSYLIMWDNAWSPNGFDFELTHSEETPVPGEFCGSAIEVDLGQHLVDAMDGDAAVAGMNINTFTSSTTPYAQSKWFSYTSDSSGVASISSCEGAISDTHVYVYTGECGTFESLTLYASNDNGEDCPDLQSYVEFDVEAGETYYIEWIDRWEEAAFVWELCRNGLCSPPVINSTEELAESFTLYPNPASDFVILDFNLHQALENVQLSITNTSGIKLYEVYVKTVQNGKLEINLSGYLSGVYFLQFSDGERQVFKRIVIE